MPGSPRGAVRPACRSLASSFKSESQQMQQHCTRAWRSRSSNGDDLDVSEGASGAGGARQYARIGHNLGEANALQSLGDLARRRDDLDGAKLASGAGRAPIYARIGDNPRRKANALQSLSDLASSTPTTSMERRRFWRQGAARGHNTRESATTSAKPMRLSLKAISRRSTRRPRWSEGASGGQARAT